LEILTEGTAFTFSYRYGRSYALKKKSDSLYTKLTSAEMHAKTCFALQVKRPSSLSTDRNRTDIVK